LDLQNPFAFFVGMVVNILIVLVVMAAVPVIVWGGYVYMTAAGSAERVGEAKKWIFGALIGIVLALSAWVILWTVNPLTT
jgi:hypothetical protein